MSSNVRTRSPSRSREKSRNDESQSSSPVVVSILLPTYNERDNLPLMVSLLHRFRPPTAVFEVIVIDDNSPDGTGNIADTLCHTYSSQEFVVKSLHRSGKLGLGSAYRFGLKESSGDFVVLMDADFSHHPKFVEKMIGIQRKTDCDIVTGSRYVESGGVVGWSLMRILTSRVANFCAVTLLGLQREAKREASDLTGSFRLYKREVIEKIMPSVISTGYVFQIEILVRALSMGLKVEVQPITFVDRIFGESKLGGNEILQYLKGLIPLFMMQK